MADPQRRADVLEIAALAAAALGATATAQPGGTARPKPAFAEDRYLEALGHLRRYENEASVDAAIRILEVLGDSPQVAAARALSDLAHHLLDQAAHRIESWEGQPVHLTR